MHLKLGEAADFDDIRRMAIAFFEASPYAPLGVDKDRVNDIIALFLSAPKEDKITILAMADDHPVGVLAAAAETNLFNSQRMAGELIWWIDPEYRKGKAAVQMLSAYEFWAKKVGCQFCTMVDLLGNLETFYKRKGYERRETSYLKVL